MCFAKQICEDKSLSQSHAFILDFWNMFGILNQNLRFWIEKTCFLSFSTKSHAESSRKFFEKTILNSKHAKLDQKSEIRHVRSCQDLSRRTSTYFKPSEILLFFQILQVLTSNHRKYFYFFQILHLSIFYEQIYHLFYKIICFYKQIHYFL